jgi:glycosyltransferase involved in cell wall biosynthesis
MAERKRIAFVINSLGAGGAERVLDNLMRQTPLNSWEPHLILLDQEPEFRTPPDFVKLHRLDCKHGMMASFKQLGAILKAIRPDLVVSFLVRANVAAVMAARAIKVPVIISERSHLTSHLDEEHKGLKRLAAKALPRYTYPKANHVIAVSEGVRSDLIGRFGVRPERTNSIPNPYDLDRIVRDATAMPEFQLPERFIVSAGRLVKRKGFDDLLEAYSRVRPEQDLCILGIGAEHARLSTMIATLGLQDKIHLLGYAKNPFSIVARADFFVSPSHVEGFPNSIAESMVLGVPVVSTDCPSGPAEILDDVESVGFEGVYEGKYGVLVPVKAPHLLAKGIRLMSEPEKRSHYSAKARERMADFRIDAIAGRYWKTFADVLSGSPTLKAPKRAHRAAAKAGAASAAGDHA